MKKLYLKNHIQKLLLIYQIILIILISCECNNIQTFMLSKLITLILIYVNHIIIKKYTKIYN